MDLEFGKLSLLIFDINRIFGIFKIEKNLIGIFLLGKFLVENILINTGSIN